MWRIPYNPQLRAYCCPLYEKVGYSWCGYIAYIYKERGEDNRYICFNSSVLNLSVVIGNHNIDPKRNDLTRYAVKSVHIHPSFKKPSKGFDITLLKV